MAEKQETTADIIAEMRRRIAVKMSDAWYTQEEWRKLCDRLEAAIRREKAAVEADALDVGGMVGAVHRRELSKNVSKNGADFGQLGDSAKLREALERVIEIANKEWDAFRETSAMWEIHEICTAALAAPMRNCDKYVSLDEARNAYMAINEMPEGNRDEDMRRWLCDFHNWLFDPATEKEGGTR